LNVTDVGGSISPLQRATTDIARPTGTTSDAPRANPDLKQRLLIDFFPPQLRQQDARLSLTPDPRSGSLLSSQTAPVFTARPHQPIADSERGGKDHCPSSKIVETHEQRPMRFNGTQIPHSPQRSSDVPMLTTATSERLHLGRPGLSMPVYTVQFSSFDDRRVLVREVTPGSTPWEPGTVGLYPRPRGAHRSNAQATAFPVWNMRMEGKGWQQAMFHAADIIEQNGATGGGENVWPLGIIGVLRSGGRMDPEGWESLGTWKDFRSLPKSNRLCHSAPGNRPHSMLLRNYQSRSRVQSVL
jgi:hypothetical protein